MPWVSGMEASHGGEGVQGSGEAPAARAILDAAKRATEPFAYAAYWHIEAKLLR